MAGVDTDHLAAGMIRDATVAGLNGGIGSGCRAPADFGPSHLVRSVALDDPAVTVLFEFEGSLPIASRPSPAAPWRKSAQGGPLAGPSPPLDHSDSVSGIHCPALAVEIAPIPAGDGHLVGGLRPLWGMVDDHAIASG